MEQLADTRQQAVATLLEGARRATEAVLGDVTDDDLTLQVSPLQSPLVWDFAHIAYFEELWLLRRVGGMPPLHEVHDDVYDAFAHARAERASLPILSPAAARAYAADVRARVLELVAATPLDTDDPLTAGGFVFAMVAQHELQHQETMLQTLSLRDAPYTPPLRRPTPAPWPGGPDEAALEAGAFLLGAEDEPWAYDNERPAHGVETGPYRIDRRPVTVAAFAEFVASGYRDDACWSQEGLRWRDEEHAIGPLHAVGARSRRRFGRTEHLSDDEPVQHVSWYEADAYARWTGARLPSEAEWERAAKAGLLEGVGQVWEWTSSTFGPYPGYRTFPYPEYSEVFFGDGYRVLRGASWATHPVVSRVSFRNWDLPQRRQIFSGFRCAR